MILKTLSDRKHIKPTDYFENCIEKNNKEINNIRSRILQNLGPKQNSVLPLKKNTINEFKKRRKNTPRPWKLSFT